jgi:hypothetical protein
VYLEQLIHTIFGYLRAFFSVLRNSSLNPFGPMQGTKSQIARFYFVVLVIGGFAIFYLLNDSNFYISDTGTDHVTIPGEYCLPAKKLGIWTVFVLAEVASVTIFVFALFSAWVIKRLTSPLTPVSISHLASALHRLLAPWFPIALAVSVYWMSPYIIAVTNKCKNPTTRATSEFIYTAQLWGAELYPFFLAATLAIVAAPVAISIWRKSIAVGYNPAIVATVYCLAALGSYSLALALVGPSDLLGIVKLLRYVADPKTLLDILIG